MHYQRQKNGRPLGSADPLSLHGISAEARFWGFVMQDDDSGCWPWQGALVDGYGVLRVEGKKTKAHRFAYELLEGAIPAGLTIDHLCCNKGCVNPGHMEPVTAVENTMRGTAVPALNARKTHCKRGHLLEGDNLKPDLRLGRRICRECSRIHRRTRYLRHGK
jgi:hypothetical protein